MKRITQRDIVFFILGLVFMLMVVLAFDWQDFVQGLTGGANPHAQTEQVSK